jgi:hypothetical protein
MVMIESCNGINPDSWEQEVRAMQHVPLSPGEALETLELNHSDIHSKTYDSILPSEWESIDNGRMFLEIRNKDYRSKESLPIILSDFDDCVMRTTSWHNEEYHLLNTNPELLSKGISIPKEYAKEIYEMSKIFVPGKAAQEKRYTPRLNFVLLSQFGFFLSTGDSPQEAMYIIKGIHATYAKRVQTEGDIFLLEKPIDKDILRAVKQNSPKAYLYEKFVSELFQNPDKNLHIIVTRGKPEGLLGQVYKVHKSGALEHPVDLILYTNDIKAEALVVLSKIIPWTRKVPINIYDDNPNEVLPYLKFIRERNINTMMVTHVRHPDAKRKDIEIEETPINSWSDRKTRTQFDVYHPNKTW